MNFDSKLRELLREVKYLLILDVEVRPSYSHFYCYFYSYSTCSDSDSNSSGSVISTTHRHSSNNKDEDIISPYNSNIESFTLIAKKNKQEEEDNDKFDTE